MACKCNDKIWGCNFVQWYVLVLMIFHLRSCLTLCVATATPDSEPSEWFCDDCLTYDMLRLAYGWSYQLDNVGTKLAITVMVIYCTLAAAHFLYSIISGLSSSTWDSVAELFALAMNSQPTRVLQNTCAGIIGSKAFRASVQIFETTEGHLELCFQDSEPDPHALLAKVRVNEKYGHVACCKEKED